MHERTYVSTYDTSKYFDFLVRTADAIMILVSAFKKSNVQAIWHKMTAGCFYNNNNCMPHFHTTCFELSCGWFHYSLAPWQTGTTIGPWQALAGSGCLPDPAPAQCHPPPQSWLVTNYSCAAYARGTISSTRAPQRPCVWETGNARLAFLGPWGRDLPCTSIKSVALWIVHNVQSWMLVLSNVDRLQVSNDPEEFSTCVTGVLYDERVHTHPCSVLPPLPPPGQPVARASTVRRSSFSWCRPESENILCLRESNHICAPNPPTIFYGY